MKQYRIDVLMEGCRKSLHGYGGVKEAYEVVKYLLKEKKARILKVKVQ